MESLSVPYENHCGRHAGNESTTARNSQEFSHGITDNQLRPL